MKKRAMKKWIPRHTGSCGWCKNLEYAYTRNDHMIIPKELGSDEMMQVPCKVQIQKCRYTGRTTANDFCLMDYCKICNVGED